MTSGQQTITATRLFDGHELHQHQGLVIQEGQIVDRLTISEIPEDWETLDDHQDLIAPAFVDLQVNGGGGVMLNDAPTSDQMAIMAEAHARFGSMAILPTLITDHHQATSSAIEAAIEAVTKGIEGVAGLHLEGPHLSMARKGAHDPTLIRPMKEKDLLLLCHSADKLPSLMVTIAPETVTPDQIRQMTKAGIIVSLGHSDADYQTCLRAIDAGAHCVTHLFNAMSQLGNREPGLVGAALNSALVHAGLIVDTVHVHPATIDIALRAKQEPGALFLVTDAMATAGTEDQGFTLNGRWVGRANNRLTLADGTLAGADLLMADAVRLLNKETGASLETALAMATSGPADVIRRKDLGRLTRGGRADFICLTETLKLKSSWRKGQKLAEHT